MFSLPDTVSEDIMFCFYTVPLFHSSVCLFVRSDIVTMISHEWLGHFYETDREYSLALTDDLDSAR